MDAPRRHVGPIDRRQFLATLSAAASTLAASAASAEEPVLLPDNAITLAPTPLPHIQLGKHPISRLIAGHNPIAGYSYLGHHMDQHMRDYFTVERIVQFIADCEQNGITALQFSWLDKTVQAIRIARERGSKMRFLCLGRERQQIKTIADNSSPIAIVHHGGATDILFAQGKHAEVRDFVKAVHDQGLLAGVSAHNPDCIKRIADEAWDVDFFMTCFYFLTRKEVGQFNGKPWTPPTLDVPYAFMKDDPPAMTQVIRQVKQPCLAFKILGAGRLCGSQETVRTAFKYAFDNIKPTDAVIVGMYPRHFDEIQANTRYTRSA